MEIRRTIKATDEEMSRVFDYDEILNVRYCEKQKMAYSVSDSEYRNAA